MKSFLTLTACAALGLTSLHADVKLPAVFGDHMVLQEGKPIPVWGTAAPGEKVTVKIGAQTADATAGADGNWKVNLKPLAESSTGTTLTVTGTNTVTFQDVVVGDVWFASGQSNMELHVGDLVGASKDPALKSPIDIPQAIADAGKHPLVRFFYVGKKPAVTPRSDVSQGKWEPSSPETTPHVSAVAYFFALELEAKLHRPIGVIEADWGGQPIQTFMSRESLEKLAFAASGLQYIQPLVDAWNKLDAAGQKAAGPDFEAKLKDWNTNVDVPFRAAMKDWQEKADAAKAAGQPEPPRPTPSAPRPVNPDGEAGMFTTLFNGMVNPVIPYPIKGAIWYQGESNGGHPPGSDEYGPLLEGMITDWRARWGVGDFTFIAVDLANFGYRYPDPVDEGWAHVREGEIDATHKLKNVAVAEAIDIGQAKNIHPIDKLDLSKRLAAAALHVAYGHKAIGTGPAYESMKVQGGKIRVNFTHTGGGLKIGVSPHIIDDNPALPTDKLVGFAIAGDDKKWVWADAKISGDSVIVSSPQVPNPVAVRYGWANNPAVNLYNAEGFPADPFRTDNWPFVNPPNPPAKW